MTSIFFAPEAPDDLEEIYDYVADRDPVGKANALLDRLESSCLALANHPERGHAVPELKRVHVTGFLEIHFKPYRILYQIREKNVYVHAVLDGRRDLRELLERRVLR